MVPPQCLNVLKDISNSLGFCRFLAALYHGVGERMLQEENKRLKEKIKKLKLLRDKSS
jgi:hypothetical protein